MDYNINPIEDIENYYYDSVDKFVSKRVVKKGKSEHERKIGE